MKASRPVSVKSVFVTINDVTYAGTYYVIGTTVHVQSTFGNKATQVGGSRPAVIAKMLLSELARGK
jgi:hypothetical protein